MVRVEAHQEQRALLVVLVVLVVLTVRAVQAVQAVILRVVTLVRAVRGDTEPLPLLGRAMLVLPVRPVVPPEVR